MTAPYFTNWRSWSVLVSEKIDSLLIQGLRSIGFGVVREIDDVEENQLISMIPNYDVLIVGDFTDVSRQVLEAGCLGGRLKIVAKSGTDLENIDVDSIKEYGIMFMHTPDVYTISIAEFTCALLMAMSRNLPQACDSMRKLAGMNALPMGCRSEDVQANVRSHLDWSRHVYTGVELYGKTLGIIGVGRVGQAVAKRMLSFGMHVIGYDPHVPSEVFQSVGVENLPLMEVFRRADFISLHASINDQSEHIVNAETLSLCKKGFCLINCADYELVNESDLVVALDTGICAAAALDSFDEITENNVALIGHPKIICTPNLAQCTIEAKHRVSFDLLIKLRAAIENQWKVGECQNVKLLPSHIIPEC